MIRTYTEFFRIDFCWQDETLNEKKRDYLIQSPLTEGVAYVTAMSGFT